MLLQKKISGSLLSLFTVVCLIIAVLSLSSCSVPSPTISNPPTSSASVSEVSSGYSSVSASSVVSSGVSSTASSPVDQVKAVKDFLAGLSPSDISNGEKAIDFIKANAANVSTQENKDILLGLYLTYSYKLVFALMDTQFDNLNTQRNASQASFNVLIAKNGLRTLEVDGSFVLVPDFNIIITSMSSILSENGSIYCGLMVSLHNMEPIASESGILAPLPDLKKLQAEWAAFITKITPSTVEFPPSDSTFKGHFEARKVLARLNSLLKIT